MGDFLATLIGKSVRYSLFFRRDGGHTLPGLILERLFPGYLPSMLSKLPEGVVIITGTNGKTTTTKMVVHILRACGKKVLTNSTGSNLIRGLNSAVARKATISGNLAYDLAVFEVDEATARLLVKIRRPDWVVGLNVSRDQLDRFGEIDTIARHIRETMRTAKKGVVTNADDPALAQIGIQLSASGKQVHYFGVANKLKKYFPSDYELAAVEKKVANEPSISTKVDVELGGFDGQGVTYKIAEHDLKANLKLSGQHNYLNGAAALTLCRLLLANITDADLVARLANVSLAFGRGEKYRLQNGAQVELVLVKNPASFTQALLSYADKEAKLLMAINDNIADGRDVSWLWDVDFTPLKRRKIFITSGKRAADMALRLSYDDITTQNIEPSLPKALKQLTEQPGKKIILATYTAMLEFYNYLSKYKEEF